MLKIEVILNTLDALYPVWVSNGGYYIAVARSDPGSNVRTIRGRVFCRRYAYITALGKKLLSRRLYWKYSKPKPKLPQDLSCISKCAAGGFVSNILASSNQNKTLHAFSRKLMGM